MSASAGHDLVTMGRSSIDLYSADIGAPFAEITAFNAYVGGSPTNISVGTRRLGLRPALLTALGQDPVGDFILRFLDTEGVETRYIPRKPGKRTSAVLLGIEPPDRFPLIFYRDSCADIELTIDDVLATPVAESRGLLISGTALSKEPSRSASIFAAEVAHAAGRTVYLDVDFRPDQWHDPRAFGVVTRGVLPLVDVVIGTADEIRAAASFSGFQVTHSQQSDARVEGDLEAAIGRILGFGPAALVVKQGLQGTSVYAGNEVVRAEAFPVDVLNILGAGDAFASGFIYGHLRGWDWHKAGRMGNACGAIVVTRPACANSMPTLAEVEAFVAERGGL